ncbi:MAG: nucleotidyltransferase [candidate division WOR-3 bacterium]|nr:MAG: nucleotidyltransferase [candidate division WOR-3 bacterium]
MLSKDFREFLGLLNKYNVKYLVVGGYAVAFHGYPRYTRDIDIWVESSPVNAGNIMKVLDDFGFATLDIKAEDFLIPRRVIQLGYPPHRIDLVTSLSDVEFKDCYNVKVTAQINGVTVNFIDLENLRRNKQASNRPQDIADLEHLQ